MPETRCIIPRVDTLIVGGGSVVHAAPPSLVEAVTRAARTSRRVAAICTGAFIVGEAGLLDGRRATTHWMHARDLQNRFPKCLADADRIFINDGPIWTSAGMSAGVDLALARIEADVGKPVAQAVAKKLVLYHRRAGASRISRPSLSSMRSPTDFRPRSFTPGRT